MQKPDVLEIVMGRLIAAMLLIALTCGSPAFAQLPIAGSPEASLAALDTKQKERCCHTKSLGG